MIRRVHPARRATVLGMVCAAWWVTPQALSAEGSSALTPQARRLAIESRFQDDSQRCAQRFDVNACLEKARAARRQGLQEIREEELRQDELKRQARAQARREAVQAKQQDAAARAASAASASGPASSQPAGARRERVAPPAAHSPSASAVRTGPAPGDEAAAAERAARAQARQREFEARQARVQQRLKERQARGVVESPLPVPSSPAR